ncbi:hypothetical protein TRIUR3_04169 [Triticum urartu]|uniref:Uncharacterized protein n=1 Tax=Triticum urartu TaxID=4572 RepID=M7YWE5_TRIUA|nr:hypothetical protein TRIUR3_04169 [Triticum urartu]
MGINPKPFDPETYMEEDDFITDESKGKESVHMDVVRCRRAKNADGTESLESNARFVQWKDGSMQLLIGHVALDGLLQSQGRLLQKMRIMPPESSSRSHSSLTAPIDSQNEKTIKVQTWYDKKYPERMKQERERDEAPSSWYNPHGRVAHSGFEHNLEFEALAQRRIINAKVHEYSDSESEELEYGTEFKDIESSRRHERQNELDENNVYDKDLDVSSLPNEEIEDGGIPWKILWLCSYQILRADVTKTSINVGVSTFFLSATSVAGYRHCQNLIPTVLQQHLLNGQGQEHKRRPRKGKVIDFGEELYPPKKRFLNRWRRQLLLTAMTSEKNCQHQTEQSKRN